MDSYRIIADNVPSELADEIVSSLMKAGCNFSCNKQSRPALPKDEKIPDGMGQSKIIPAIVQALKDRYPAALGRDDIAEAVRDKGFGSGRNLTYALTTAVDRGLIKRPSLGFYTLAGEP